MDFHFEGDSVVYHSDLLIERGYVDCGKNEDLFLALAELRNDSDIGQWFKCGGFIFYCEDHDEPDPKTGDYVMKLTESKDDEWYALLPRSECEKLTVEELIEHLDKKK